MSEFSAQGSASERSKTPGEPLSNLGEIIGDLTRNVSTLMRQEVALAKAEVSQSAKRAGSGIGMLVAAGVAGLLFLVFLSIAAWWGIGNYTGRGWAGLIVAAVWLVIAIILATVGKKKMQEVNGMPETGDTLAKVPNALKGQEGNNR
jgi:hypothetical protein